MRNYIVQDVDIRKVVGIFHDNSNQEDLTWHLLFQMPENLYVPFFDKHLNSINRDQTYFDNKQIIAQSNDDYVEYVSYDAGETFYIENGNRRTIIAKHYFSAEEFFTGLSSYTIKNVIVHFID